MFHIGSGEHVGSMWGVNKVNIMNASLAIVSFSTHLGYNSLLSYIGGGGGL